MSLKFSCIGLPKYEPLTERHVQAIWYDQTMRPPNLRTVAGERVRVVHPGEWNLGPGPDFTNATLEIVREGGPQLVKGDVEIHLSPRDWEAHGHGNDPRYAHVVAHVTWFEGPVPPTLPKNAVSIALGHLFTHEAGFSPDQIDLAAYPFDRLPADERPCQPWLSASPAVARRLLGEAGLFRLGLKARRLQLLLSNQLCGRTQLFYEEIMAALGYKENARNFRAIAQAVPYDRLVAEPENAAAALLGAGSFVAWSRTPHRPRNSPSARLAAAAFLFTQTDILLALDWTDFSPKGCRGLLRLLLDGHVLGRGRAAAILANVVIPFALYEGRIDEPLAWLPPEDISQPVRLTAFRLLGREHSPLDLYARDGLRIQGLLQIHRSFCLPIHPECGTCFLSKEHRFPSAEAAVEYGT